MQAQFTLAIHGGAGTIDRDRMLPELEAQYRQGLEEALKAGLKVLENRGNAGDAVIAAVIELENNPLFNAGKGSVFNNAGKHEMDASIMLGHDLSAGAVSGVRNIKNPILLAKEIMLHSSHVLLSGEGAEKFAASRGILSEPDEYFYTDFRYKQWLELKGSEDYALDHSTDPSRKMGTVGAVALDMNGNLAAATSTGGMTNKRFGRIGDTPIIGAGTYANNTTCAVSCTGHGELFIRSVVAYDISCLMEYKGLSLQDACDTVVMDKLVKIEGEGGLVAVDAKGNISMPFNSSGMYRACGGSGKENFIGIYR